MRKIRLGFILLISINVNSIAQNGWNWPEDKGTAEEKNVIYTDAMKAENYSEALEPLNWLLNNAPDLNPSLYINGVKIYTSLAEASTDPSEIETYREKTLELYDKRIEYFGKEVDVLNRKAYAAYKFYRGDNAKYGDLLALYELTYEKSGNRIHTNNLVAYMDIIRKFKLSGGDISEESILERYDQINGLLDSKIAAGADSDKYEPYREALDQMLMEVVPLDCEFIRETLGVKLTSDPTNTKLAKKVMGLSLAAKCSDEPVFLEAAIIVQDEEPTYGVAKLIAIKTNANGDFDKALNYYNQAIELSDEASKKADIYFELAINYTKKGLKPQARTQALNAVRTDPSMTKAYKLIGDLYLGSFLECKKGESKVEDRAVYIAAYDMYKKADDTHMMQNMLEQFPSIEDIFELNLEEGETIKVGCWINETVTIQRRPS